LKINKEWLKSKGIWEKSLNRFNNNFDSDVEIEVWLKFD